MSFVALPETKFNVFHLLNDPSPSCCWLKRDKGKSQWRFLGEDGEITQWLMFYMCSLSNIVMMYMHSKHQKHHQILMLMQQF